MKSGDIETTFLEAERDGIKLAIKGRFIAIVAIGAWYLLTRTDRLPNPPPPSPCWP